MISEFVENIKDHSLVDYLGSVAEKAYKEQEKIKDNLGNSAQRLIALISAIVSIQLIKLDSLNLSFEPIKLFPSITTIVALLFLGLSLFYSILSLLPHGEGYKGLPKNGDSFCILFNPNDSALVAKNKMMMFYLFAVEINYKVNTQRGEQVKTSSKFAIIGATLAGLRYFITQF